MPRSATRGRPMTHVDAPSTGSPHPGDRYGAGMPIVTTASPAFTGGPASPYIT